MFPYNHTVVVGVVRICGLELQDIFLQLFSEGCLIPGTSYCSGNYSQIIPHALWQGVYACTTVFKVCA